MAPDLGQPGRGCRHIPIETFADQSTPALQSEGVAGSEPAALIPSIIIPHILRNWAIFSSSLSVLKDLEPACANRLRAYFAPVFVVVLGMAPYTSNIADLIRGLSFALIASLNSHKRRYSRATSSGVNIALGLSAISVLIPAGHAAPRLSQTT